MIKLLIWVLKAFVRSINSHKELLEVNEVELIATNHDVCSYLESCRDLLFIIFEKSMLPIGASAEKTTVPAYLWLVQYSIWVLYFTSNFLNLMLFIFTLIIVYFECLEVILEIYFFLMLIVKLIVLSHLFNIQNA